MEIRRAEIDGLPLGRRGLRADEIAHLDEEGFVVIPSLLHQREIDPLIVEFEQRMADEPTAHTEERGCRRAVAVGDVFDVCWRHRAVLDAATHILGDHFQVGGVGLRDAQPGGGHQKLHPDYGATPAIGLVATWFFDDFTIENGATRVLPGSHRSTVAPPGAGNLEPVAGEVIAVGLAGSVLLRHAYLFHAGGRNATDAPRRAGLVFFLHELG
jgi:hypothetical protein